MAQYTHVERDDIHHALQQLLAFYDKELDDRSWRFWFAVLKKFPPDILKRAMAQYIEEGKYAPKPANIAEIAKRYISNVPAHHTAKAEKVKRAAPETEKAWQWYLAMRTQSSGIAVFQSALEGMTPELEERYLHIVNSEAAKANCPEAIEDEHKLKQYWG